jgi:hypothetical protein
VFICCFLSPFFSCPHENVENQIAFATIEAFAIYFSSSHYALRQKTKKRKSMPAHLQTSTFVVVQLTLHAFSSLSILTDAVQACQQPTKEKSPQIRAL